MPYPDRHIGLFEIGDVTQTEDSAIQKVKVKVRVNANGIFGVSSANLFDGDGLVTDLRLSQRVPDHLSYKRLQAAVRVNCQQLDVLILPKSDRRGGKYEERTNSW